jgi:transcriptional regulator with XRE-family HTH domain
VTIAARLREEREHVGATQEAMARHTGVGKRSQIDYESGRTAPNARYLAKAAEHGVDVLYVITGQRFATPTPSVGVDLATLVSNFNAASEDGKRFIEGAASFAASLARARS